MPTSLPPLSAALRVPPPPSPLPCFACLSRDDRCPLLWWRQRAIDDARAAAAEGGEAAAAAAEAARRAREAAAEEARRAREADEEAKRRKLADLDASMEQTMSTDEGELEKLRQAKLGKYSADFHRAAAVAKAMREAEEAHEEQLEEMRAELEAQIDQACKEADDEAAAARTFQLTLADEVRLLELSGGASGADVEAARKAASERQAALEQVQTAL